MLLSTLETLYGCIWAFMPGLALIGLLVVLQMAGIVHGVDTSTQGTVL